MLPFPWISVILYSFIEIQKKYHILSEQDKKTTHIYLYNILKKSMWSKDPLLPSSHAFSAWLESYEG